MSDKVKPWHNRKPKHGKEQERSKRKRSPITQDNNGDSSRRVDEKGPSEYDPANYSERWES